MCSGGGSVYNIMLLAWYHEYHVDIISCNNGQTQGPLIPASLTHIHTFPKKNGHYGTNCYVYSGFEAFGPKNCENFQNLGKPKLKFWQNSQ